MTLVIPNMTAPMVGKGGVIIPPWNSFFQQFTGSPSGIMSIVLGASPFTYQAGEPGTVVISGGTVSAVHLIRGSVNINMGTARAIVVSRFDQIQITYSVLPVVQFVPFYSTPVN